MDSRCFYFVTWQAYFKNSRLAVLNDSPMSSHGRVRHLLVPDSVEVKQRRQRWDGDLAKAAISCPTITSYRCVVINLHSPQWNSKFRLPLQIMYIGLFNEIFTQFFVALLFIFNVISFLAMSVWISHRLILSKLCFNSMLAIPAVAYHLLSH